MSYVRHPISEGDDDDDDDSKGRERCPCKKKYRYNKKGSMGSTGSRWDEESVDY